jgi:hypothetical protein
MVLTVSFVLSPVIGLSCHRHPSDMADPRPVGPTLPPLNLTPASRRQDHTTSPYAATSFVSMPPIAHRPFADLPCHHVSRLTLPRPPHSTPRFVTIMIRPSCGVGWRESVEMICPTGKAKYFCKGDLPDGQISGPRREHIALVSRTRCSALRAAPQSRDPYRHQRRGPRISSAPRQSRFSPVMIAP